MRNKTNLILLGALLALGAGMSSCRPYGGFAFYARSPRLARTHPNRVMLIERMPRGGYVELGQVWIKTKPGMDRYQVERKLRKKAARMGADAVVIIEDRYARNRVSVRRYRRGTMIYRQRRIGGIAIRFL